MAYNASDVRKILKNLFDYFNTNQTSILASVGAPSTHLTLYRTAEFLLKTDFPHLGCVKRRTTVKDDEGGLHIEYALTFQLEVKATFTEATRTAALSQLQDDVDAYQCAFETALLNIPNTTLYAGLSTVRAGYKSMTSNDPLEVAINETEAIFNTQSQAVLRFIEDTYV